MDTFTKFFESQDKDMDEYYKSIKLDKEYTTPLHAKQRECSVDYKNTDSREILCEKAIVYWGIKIEDESSIGISSLKIIVKKVEALVTIEMIDEVGDPIGEPVDENIIVELENIETDIDFGLREDYNRFHIFVSFKIFLNFLVFCVYNILAD